MYNISMNIGYETDGSSGILNRIPLVWEFGSIEDFTDFIRRCSIDFADWAIQNSVPKSSLILYTSINRYYTENGEEWNWNNDFTIHCKNIREYMPFLKMENTDISVLIEATRRDRKINDVLDGEELI
jgi:hypothetical protein